MYHEYMYINMQCGRRQSEDCSDTVTLNHHFNDSCNLAPKDSQVRIALIENLTW